MALQPHTHYFDMKKLNVKNCHHYFYWVKYYCDLSQVVLPYPNRSRCLTAAGLRLTSETQFITFKCAKK